MLDDVIQVNDEECFVWARRLAKQEGIFTGGSGGGCMAGALSVANDCKKGDLIVAFLPDTGTRYLSKIYNDAWMREHGYVDAEVTLTAADVVRHKHENGKKRDSIVVAPRSNRFPRAEYHAEAGHFADSGLRRRQPSIGTIYEDQILNLALQGKDLRKLVIREVMGPPLPQLPADAPVERVTHILSHEGPAVFIAMDNGKLEILTKFDLMDTIAGMVAQSR